MGGGLCGVPAGGGHAPGVGGASPQGPSMSAAFRCDRCKKFAAGKPVASVTYDAEVRVSRDIDRDSFRCWRRGTDPKMAS